MPKPVVIIGYAGHAYVVIEALIANGYSVIGYCDHTPKANNPYNLTYLGTEHTYFEAADSPFIVTIGDNHIREKIQIAIEAKGRQPITVVHPSAIVSNSAQIASGCYIGAGAIINALAQVGKGTIVNTNAIVEHECTVEDFAHISPGAVLCGNVFIGYRTWIGANTVIKQGIRLENDVMVGAGSVVIRPVSPHAKVAGNPAKSIVRI